MPSSPTVSKQTVKKVLFVCLGNCCRSQMAEGFANKYGSDVLEARSAGLAPAPIVAAETIQIMAEKNIDISSQFPKKFDPFETGDFDLIVNISGYQLPRVLGAPVRAWTVKDPYRLSKEIYEESANHIETLVMQLILEFRREASPRPRKQTRR